MLNTPGNATVDRAALAVALLGVAPPKQLLGHGTSRSSSPGSAPLPSGSPGQPGSRYAGGLESALAGGMGADVSPFTGVDAEAAESLRALLARSRAPGAPRADKGGIVL